MMQNRAQKLIKIFEKYQISRSGEALGASWGVFARLGGKTCRKNASWRAKAPKKCDLEESLERLETSWARLGGVLGGLGRRLGALLAPSWDLLGGKMEPSWHKIEIQEGSYIKKARKLKNNQVATKIQKKMDQL